MKDFRSVCNTIGHHGKILAKGFIRMMFGAATAGLFAMAIYGFIMISTEDGWTAVCEFIASTATVVVAMSCMYAQGGVKKRRGGYQR